MAPSDTSQNFIWGAGGTRKTPQQIARDREEAAALLRRGVDFSPIASPLQGLARVANAAAGAYGEYRADQAEAANAAASRDIATRMLSGNGGGQFPPAPVLNGGYGSPSKPPIQNILETVSGNRMPWQFPAAPSQPGIASNVAAPVMTSPRQGDRQLPSISPTPSAASAPMMGSVFGAENTSIPSSPTSSMTGNVLASTGAVLPPSNPGGFFGLFKPQSASGLW
ncbi:MAG: hypothetical protein J0I98_20585 [Mesorhizobium sp.]|nr:hypothetical protein [Mesorhizobium sp.]MBN9245181.1 hypothetical protein [Mesorhizobium sp.]